MFISADLQLVTSLTFSDTFITSPTNAAKEHMWQSQVEIEHYSVAYFDHITACNTVLLSWVGLILAV